jgi:hypothetical protein
MVSNASTRRYGMKYILTRDVTKNECPWLDRDYKKGDVVYFYNGCTYGCITLTGEPFTKNPDQTPFLELPRVAVEPLE